MRDHKVAVLVACLMLAGCANNNLAGEKGHVTDYVEVSNPALTMSPGAPATIWVPRSAVEHGVPRGGAAIRQGVQEIVDGIKVDPRQDRSQDAVPLKVDPTR